MDTFYITPEEFWNRFNAVECEQHEVTTKKAKLNALAPASACTSDSVPRSGTRYIIMYGRHRPGKKTKIWEADGYLSLVGQVAYVTDLRGRLLEEPTLLQAEDYDVIEDLGEILIGKTEIQVIEVDHKK